MPRASRGQRIRDAFFTRVSPESDEWICVCGTKRKNAGTAYTNLVSHIQVQHPNELQNVDSAESISSFHSSNAPRSIFYPKKTLQVTGCLKLVINELLPFRIVESEVYRKSVKYPPISRPTLMKYMSSLTKHVEKRLVLNFSLNFVSFSIAGAQIYLITFLYLQGFQILLKNVVTEVFY